MVADCFDERVWQVIEAEPKKVRVGNVENAIAIKSRGEIGETHCPMNNGDIQSIAYAAPIKAQQPQPQRKDRKRETDVENERE